MHFIFSYGGIIVVILLIILTSSIRIKDCLDNKRSFFKSIIISVGILAINWIVAGSMFLACVLFGELLKEQFYAPFYLQFAYFVFCALVGMYLFSKFYILGHKFYSNFRDKGIFSFKFKKKDMLY